MKNQTLRKFAVATAEKITVFHFTLFFLFGYSIIVGPVKWSFLGLLIAGLLSYDILNAFKDSFKLEDVLDPDTDIYGEPLPPQPTTPEVTETVAETPEVETPEVETPEVETPEVETVVWRKSWSKATLLKAAIDAGLDVSKEDTIEEIIEALEALDKKKE